MSNRAILLAALVLLAAGIVLAAVGSSVLVTAIGWALFGVALVILVSLLFLLVGESEDRDRLRNPRG
jgi:membrane protein implicated in regulation of membrane protease activity